MRTVATRTFRTACGYGFTVCIFAIKVWFAAFIVAEVTAAFEGNCLFAFAAWLSRRTLTAPPAFSARTLT
jgi:hypothetical protein